MLQDKPITIFFSKRSAVKKEIRNMNVKGKAEEGRERKVRKRELGREKVSEIDRRLERENL